MAVIWTVFLVPSASAADFDFLRAFGPDGTDTTGFSDPGLAASKSIAVDNNDNVVYVLDGGADALFKFDFEGNPVDFGGLSPNISGNELNGLAVGGGRGERQVAVNPDTHIIYLTGGNTGSGAKAVQAFDSNGDPANFTAGPGAGSNEISGFPSLRGVAVDSFGNIYLSGARDEGGFGQDVAVYSSTGAVKLPRIAGPNTPENTFFINTPANIAVDSTGTVYVSTIQRVRRYIPSEYPITPSTTYTGSAEPVDPRPVQSLAVDSLTDELYVSEVFEEDGALVSQVSVFNKEGALEGVFGDPGSAGALAFADGVAVANVGEVGDEGNISKPFVVTNPQGGLAQVEVFLERFIVAAPTVESTAVASVAGDSATLRAWINPNNRKTTYWFEYGLENCETSVTCARAPIDSQSIGDGRKGVFVQQPVAGLQKESVYHYRVVAENELGIKEGSSSTFRTQGSGLGFLLGDSRVWEMVSPQNKYSGALLVDGSTTIQASGSGDKLIYASRGSIVEEPDGNRLLEPSTVLANRDGDGGWNSEDLTVPHSEATVALRGTEYKFFSSDLSQAVLVPRDGTPLSPESSEQTPYLWAHGTPFPFTPLITAANVPPGTKFGPQMGGISNPLELEGVSADLENVVIRAAVVPLAEGAPPRAIYRWANDELEVVSELPDSEGGGVVEGVLGSGSGSVRHAVSTDGSRMFWSPTTGGNYDLAGIHLQALYFRDTVARESTRIDVVQEGVSGGTEPLPAFNAASAGGDVVFFTDSQRLTDDASATGRDLYRCRIEEVEGSSECVDLIDISAPLDGSGESAEVLDQVPGLSEDGTRLYFVARGVLDVTPNEREEAAIPGEPNLYLWEEGVGSRFVATLADTDSLVWGGQPNIGFAMTISAEASPGGRYFVFTSEMPLTGYENKNGSGEATTEVFMFDAEASVDELTCVSCNPTGAAAVGERIPESESFLPQDPASLWGDRWVAATLPAATRTESDRSLYRPRSVLDNGRVFFNAVDPLVPADSNGNWDVYQYEPAGVGTCTALTSTASMVGSGSGCVALLSSGTADADSGFLDASVSGDDVFFLTQGRLSVLDRDKEFDAYDARVNGIPAALSPVRECAGETCQPSGVPPNDPTPASESFRGAETPIKCRKGQRKIRRKGRTICVRKKQKKHLKQAGRNGRALK